MSPQLPLQPRLAALIAALVLLSTPVTAFDLGGSLDDFAWAAGLQGDDLVVGGRAQYDSNTQLGALARLRLHLFADGFESGTTGKWSTSQP